MQSSTEQLRCMLGSGDRARATYRKAEDESEGGECFSIDLHLGSNAGGGGRRNRPAGGGRLPERRNVESLERSGFFFLVFCGSRTWAKSRIQKNR